MLEKKKTNQPKQTAHARGVENSFPREKVEICILGAPNRQFLRVNTTLVLTSADFKLGPLK